MTLAKFLSNFLISAVSACGLMASASATTVTHDDPDGFRTNRRPGDTPVGQLTVDAAQTISSFGIDVDLNSNGNLDFLIFNSTTGDLLYQSGPTAFTDTGGGFKFSNGFSFTFLPGITYGLTAASDVRGQYLVDFTANTVGSFNFLASNQNSQGAFGGPYTLPLGTACCDVSTALVLASSVPEPGTLALTSLGLFGVLRLRRFASK